MVDINIGYPKYDTPLHLVAISGTVQIIKILLDNGLSVDLRNGWESTPLHKSMSAACGKLEATKAFVERGAAVDKDDKNGDIPLLLAARYGKLEVFRYLTEEGADINIRDVHTNNVLHYAATSGTVWNYQDFTR